MVERNQRKRLGRFIKHNDALISHLDMREYSFDTMTSDDPIYFDNPGNNLIYARYHDEVAIKKNVRPHKGMYRDMRTEDEVNPILEPADFTAEWARLRDRAARKSKGKIEDEDEYDYELEQKAKQALSEREPEDLEPTPTVEAKTEPPVDPLPLSTDKDPGREYFRTQKNNIDQISKLIDSDVNEELKAENPLQDDLKTMIDPPQSPSPPKVDHVFEAIKGEIKPEPKISESELEEIRQASQREGFESGFRVGEEKATLQSMEITKSMVSSMESLLSELSNVRAKVLKDQQDNFLTVCQALAESLIGKELEINHNSFFGLIERVAHQTIGAEVYKIHIHPKTLQLMDAHSSIDFKSKLIADDSIEQGQFKLETDKSAFVADLPTLIKELLSKMDREILSAATKVAS